MFNVGYTEEEYFKLIVNSMVLLKYHVKQLSIMKEK